MSKGHGAIERAVLEALRKRQREAYVGDLGFGARTDQTLHQIVWVACPGTGENRWRNPAYRNAADSVRRALKALEQKGLVRLAVTDRLGAKKTWALRGWRPSAEDKRQREERARERARKEAEEKQRYHQMTWAIPKRAGDTGRLAKLLAMLGSPEAGERDNAARMVDEERRRLGRSWEELLVSR